MRWTRTRVRHRLGRLAGRRSDPAATRVLVVDDDEVIRQLIGVHLRVGGFVPELAADGAAGLEQARAARPRVAILDAGMPGLDGWSVASCLRRDPATSSIKIIMLAPLPGPGTGPGAGLGLGARPGRGRKPGPGASGGMANGPGAGVAGAAGGSGMDGGRGVAVDACLAKPFDPAELIAAVRRLAR